MHPRRIRTRRPEMWHSHLVPGSTAVLLGTAVRWSGRRDLSDFAIFVGSFSFFVLVASRERLEGFIRVLDSCFWNEVVKINWRLLTLISSFNSSLFLSPLLFDYSF